MLSIVIPVHGGGALTKACVESLVLYPPTTSFEIILVDDASPDDATRTIVRELGAIPEVRVVWLPENGGFAAACNAGYRESRGDFILFLNNDTEVTEGWLPPLLREMEDPNVAAVGALLLYPGGRLVQHAGICFVTEKSRLVAFHRKQFWRLEMLAKESIEPHDVEAVTGACILLRRSALDAVTVFDERYRNGYEDLDLCLRLRSKGNKIRFCGHSKVIHHESVSEARFLAEKSNQELFTQRWPAAHNAHVSACANHELADLRARRAYIVRPSPRNAWRVLMQVMTVSKGETMDWATLARGAFLRFRRIPASVRDECHRRMGLDQLKIREG